jgi:hypothetical protein
VQEDSFQFQPCIIYPENRIKQIWELFMILVLLISCLITPVEIAFAKSTTPADGFDMHTIVGFVFDALFFIDVVVIFFSAYVDDNLKLVDKRKTICVTYLTGWFPVDLVSSVPFSLFDSHRGGTTDDIK